MRWTFGFLVLGGLLGCSSLGPAAGVSIEEENRPPNFVLFFADDMGWGDVGCYEGSRCRTPHLDRLAAEGLRLTSFYVGSPACSPSRAALLTGCYPQRISLPEVLNPGSQRALHPAEETIAEMLQKRGYRTGAIGKWHLGDAPEDLPTQHGFETWTGLPYSNDMWPFHYGDHDRGLIGNPNWPDLPLYDRGQVVAYNPPQESLTPLYTKRAIEFVEQHRREPFFLYLAYSHPHVPIAASPAFRGRSGDGLYADMILEIDDSVGQVVEALEANGLREDTIVLFTSDNGPWTRFGDHAGTTGPWRGDKGTCFEGGMRMPAIFWGPGHIPGGRVSDHLMTAMDVLPTIQRVAGALRPALPIDGLDQSRLLLGKSPGREREAFYYYYPDELHAVRSGRWKLHLPHEHRTVVEAGQGGLPGKQGRASIELSLFDLESDPGETTNVAAAHPEVVERLLGHARNARAWFGDALTSYEGTQVRPAKPPHPMIRSSDR